MNSKQEVIRLLKESGNYNKWSEENWQGCKEATKVAGRLYPNMKSLWDILEGTKEQYMHEIIVKNC